MTADSARFPALRPRGRFPARRAGGNGSAAPKFRPRGGRCEGGFSRSRQVRPDFAESGAGNDNPPISGTKIFFFGSSGRLLIEHQSIDSCDGPDRLQSSSILAGKRPTGLPGRSVEPECARIFYGFGLNGTYTGSFSFIRSRASPARAGTGDRLQGTGPPRWLHEEAELVPARKPIKLLT